MAKDSLLFLVDTLLLRNTSKFQSRTQIKIERLGKALNFCMIFQR